MVEKFWMVVDISGALDSYRNNGDILPPGSAPRFMHWSEDSANQECLRLSRQCSGEFVVLEAMSVARKVSSEWANLVNKGPVSTIRLDDIPDFEPDIPF